MVVLDYDTLLRDPTIEAAVLETARGGILREGLGFDRCDVGAVLNISDDHLGIKGVETIEDMARIKRQRNIPSVNSRISLSLLSCLSSFSPSSDKLFPSPIHH